MVLDAAYLGDWQSCQRRYALSTQFRPLKWRPKTLYDACLREGVLSLSQGAESPADVAAAARSRFLQSAANPGLDITTDPFLAAKDWCAMLQTTLLTLSREGVPPKLSEHPPVLLGDVKWSPLAHVSGQTLHRWVTLDYFSVTELPRELHSWRVMGDVCLTGLPMMIHIIEIGQIRSGRRASLWSRSWKHPNAPHLPMRFKGKVKGAFRGWKPFYLADSKVALAAWAEQMWTETAAQDLIHHVSVKPPAEEHCASVKRDILREEKRMRAVDIREWKELPMSRNSCDAGLPCPFQDVCYGGYDPEKSGLYKIRVIPLRPGGSSQ